MWKRKRERLKRKVIMVGISKHRHEQLCRFKNSENEGSVRLAKWLVTKPDDLCSIFGTHVVEGENNCHGGCPLNFLYIHIGCIF